MDVRYQKISKPYCPATCTWHSMFTWFTSVSFSYFSQNFFPAEGCLTSFSWFMIKKFHFQSRKKLGKLDSGKVCILTMRNDVAHSTAIKMDAARFCKKVGHPGLRQSVVTVNHWHIRWIQSIRVTGATISINLIRSPTYRWELVSELLFCRLIWQIRHKYSSIICTTIVYCTPLSLRLSSSRPCIIYIRPCVSCRRRYNIYSHKKHNNITYTLLEYSVFVSVCVMVINKMIEMFPELLS